jgi:hypothetical protein
MNDLFQHGNINNLIVPKLDDYYYQLIIKLDKLLDDIKNDTSKEILLIKIKNELENMKLLIENTKEPNINNKLLNPQFSTFNNDDDPIKINPRFKNDLENISNII